MFPKMATPCSTSSTGIANSQSSATYKLYLKFAVRESLNHTHASFADAFMTTQTL